MTSHAPLPPGVILVPCSTQLLADMEGDWSRPLQVKAQRQPDGTYELVLRNAEYGPHPHRKAGA